MPLFHVATILDQIAKGPKKETNLQIQANIDKIKKLSNSRYSDQHYYGHVALNRKMLLDPDITRLLTPEVIEYLFTNEAADEVKINRNPTGPIKLRDALYFAFEDGAQVIHYMPNNEIDFDDNLYQKQKKCFQANTLQLIKNIRIAAGDNEAEFDLPNELFDIDLTKQFERIVKVITNIRAQGESAELCRAPSYLMHSMQSMYEQVNLGFEDLLYTIFSQNLDENTVDEICEKFLQSKEAMLEGGVIQLFYDRAHIEAALIQDITTQIGGEFFTYTDIFRRMISLFVANPNRYSEVAKEQLHIRFFLVERDLQRRFNSIYEAVLSEDERLPTLIQLPERAVVEVSVPVEVSALAKVLTPAPTLELTLAPLLASVKARAVPAQLPASAPILVPPQLQVTGPASTPILVPPKSQVTGPASTPILVPPKSQVTGPASTPILVSPQLQVTGPASAPILVATRPQVTEPASAPIVVPPQLQVTGPASTPILVATRSLVSGPILVPSQSQVTAPACAPVLVPPRSSASAAIKIKSNLQQLRPLSAIKPIKVDAMMQTKLNPTFAIQALAVKNLKQGILIALMIAGLALLSIGLLALSQSCAFPLLVGILKPGLVPLALGLSGASITAVSMFGLSMSQSKNLNPRPVDFSVNTL